MVDFRFAIVTPAGEPVTDVIVSGDDILDARGDYTATTTDTEIAQDLYEQKYESALARAGCTYDDAVRLGFILAR